MMKKRLSFFQDIVFDFQSNKPVIAQRLLEGGANPTIRNQITGWVPLHEAAWNGNIDCAKILLQWDAPVMSRTPKVGPVYV